MTDTIEPTVRDLFGRHDPLLGRVLCMDQVCACGSNVTLICQGRGPHAAKLRCRNCDRHRQWLSHEDFRICGTVLAEITGRFGEPVEITYRSIKQRRIEAMAPNSSTITAGFCFATTTKTMIATAITKAKRQSPV
jgi:hypothetical protein